MKGSQKQTKWAEDIRSGLSDEVEDLRSKIGNNEEGIKEAIMTEKETYKQICQKLGFRIETKFVKITHNQHGLTIGFTTGKPGEIIELGQACQAYGYRMSAGLRRRLATL